MGNGEGRARASNAEACERKKGGQCGEVELAASSIPTRQRVPKSCRIMEGIED